MKQLTILKLGGSAITDKSRELTPDLVTIHRSADQIAKYRRPLILLHGGGSFAHPFAKRGNLAKGFRNKSQFKSLDETELYLDQLSRIVQVALLQRNVGFVPFRPMSYVETKRGNLSKAFLNPIKNALEIGLVPLSHGDVVMDSKVGFSIVSADRLASLFALKLKATKVLFGSDVDGIHTADPKGSKKARLVKEVNRKNYREILAMLGSNAPGDATGGMRTKFLEALKLAKNGCESYIFNLRQEGMLDALLSSKSEELECTRFDAWREPPLN
jgi:isopentenyl phosphate kinase